MTGRVRTSGSSRWSRSVASPTTSVANHAPKRTTASGSAPNRGTSSPNASAPTIATTAVRQSTRRAGRVLFVVLRPARREPIGRDPEDGTARAEQPGDRLHPVGRAPVEVRRVSRPAAPASASSTSVACETPVGAAWREGQRLPVVGGAGDVEMDPRHGHELAQEQAALDQRALGRARVLEVAVPAVHVRDVVVDERRAASSARRP